MPALPPAALAKLAAMIDFSTGQFAEIYNPIAAKYNGLSWMVLNLDRSRARFLNALEEADRGDWLGELTARLIEAGALEALEDDTAPINLLKVDLQKILRPEDGFHDAADFTRGSALAKRRVCRVVVSVPGEQESYGTGFLIAHQAVITNWHVIEVLTAGYAAADGSAAHLHVEFDFNSAGKAERVAVADDWLISHSPYHPSENPRAETIAVADDQFPSFQDTLDFAVIRLVRAVGYERGRYRLDARYRARLEPPGSHLTLYQHPAGQPLKHSSGTAKALWPPEVETRLHHSANSAGGSSGGLLLDARYDPVGLHQSSIDFGVTGAVNCAIPTCRIVGVLDGNEEITDSAPAICTKSGRAIIGRDDLQRDIIALAAGRQRILTLPGEAVPPVMEDMLGALLAAADHQITLFHAELLADPRSFAEEFAERVTGDTSAAAMLPDTADRMTAGAGWVKDVLIPPLIDVLREKIGSRTLWLVISGMEATEIFGRPRGLLLEQLIGRIAALPFLRIILVGYDGALPMLGYDQVVTRRYQSPSEQDCIIFARRLVVSEMLDLDDPSAVATAKALFHNTPRESDLIEQLPRTLRLLAANGGGE